MNFILYPVPIFFLLLLILVTVDFGYDRIIENDGETKTFVFFLPREDDGEGEEDNDGSLCIFFLRRLLPCYFSYSNNPTTIY